MFKRILVAVDGSETSNEALAAALELARDRSAALLLLHVIDEAPYYNDFGAYGTVGIDLIGVMRESGQRVLDDALAVAAKAGLAAEIQLCEKFGERIGDIVAQAATAWGADLIVLGTHGRRGMQRILLGSGAESIMRMAPAAVLVIRHPQK